MAVFFFGHLRDPSSRELLVVLVAALFPHERADQLLVKVVLVFLVLVSGSIAAGVSGLLLLPHPLQLQMLQDVHLAEIAVEESLVALQAGESLHELIDFR